MARGADPRAGVAQAAQPAARTAPAMAGVGPREAAGEGAGAPAMVAEEGRALAAASWGAGAMA